MASLRAEMRRHGAGGPR